MKDKKKSPTRSLAAQRKALHTTSQAREQVYYTSLSRKGQEER